MTKLVPTFLMLIVSSGMPLCAANETTTAKAPAGSDSGPKHISVFPESVLLDGRDARQQLLVTLHDQDRLQDVTRSAQYELADPTIAAVDASGVVTPNQTGETTIRITLDGLHTTVTLQVQRGQTPLPLSFARDIVPILTRRGCNGGGCHGKATGRGGFRLSLFGYNPALDYESITRDSHGRRITANNPAGSLLLQKPAMRIPHGGGRRLLPDEPEFQQIARWIESQAPRDESSGNPDAVFQSLRLEPAQRSLLPGTHQQMVALATFSDGTTRDVTRLVNFKSNDATIAEVDEWGYVTTQDRLGETAIVATYAGQVAVSRIRVPLERPWTAPEFVVQNEIDQLVLDQWQALGIPPSSISDDRTFLRRATQQIAGRLPTPDELSDFLADTSESKRTVAVNRLLDDPGYADLFAQKWATILRNKRRGQTPRIPGTIAFHRWIRNAIAINMPYDQFVREIVTATGDVAVNPPAQWYAEVRYLDRYVDDSAQVFLGMRIGCARCHHHPFESISQEDYYGIAAFFARVNRKGGAGVAERRANEAIFVTPDGTVKHPLTGEVVAPHGLGQAPLDVPKFEDPRHRYVDWMAEPDNPFFAKAFVNRMWAHFFGRGLVDPLDDLRVTNPASNEPLLDHLSAEFVRSGFNMRQVVEQICCSSTYQLSSEPNEFNLDETQNFSRFYPQRMQAEVLLDAIDQVTAVKTGFSGLPKGTRALQLPDEGYSNEFLTLFGRPPRESACECERVAEPSLSQALHTINDSFILGKVTSSKGLTARLATDKRPHEEKLNELFETVFSRPPTDSEIQSAVAYLDSETDQRKAYGNLLWALINTKEFLFIH